MSYDVSLRMPTGAGEYLEHDVRDVTYNNAPIFGKALGCGLRDLNGSRACDVVERLRAAIKSLEDNYAAYAEEARKAENAEWGGREDTLAFLRQLLKACERHPNTEVTVL